MNLETVVHSDALADAPPSDLTWSWRWAVGQPILT